MRLFVAINFSPAMRNALLATQKQLKMQARCGVYTKAANFHLTLAFVGEMENAMPVKHCLEQIKAAPFAIALSGASHFDDLYFVGLADDNQLKALAMQIRSSLISAGLPCDQRPFVPHVTIGRQIETTEKITLPVPFVGMMVDRFSLMKSERTEEGLVYTEIGRYTLADNGEKE